MMPSMAAETADSVYLDFGELDQSPPIYYAIPARRPAVLSAQPGSSSAVGVIECNESVTPTGGKIYDVPLEVSGGNRPSPEISLFYNSQGSRGTAGYGWNISGVPAITVTNGSPKYDEEGFSAPDLSKPDGCVFALDGTRLLERYSAPDGFTLETAEGYIRAQKVKSGAALSRFNVRYPDGRTAVFGFSGNTATSHVYPVTEMTGPDGYKIFYDYIHSGNAYYISHIYYGGKDRNGCYGHVAFTYSDATGFPTSYLAGVELKPDKILKKIVSSVKVNGAETELMHYDLTHSGGDLYQLTKISAGCGTELFNPLLFDYGYTGGTEGGLQKASDRKICGNDVFGSGRKIVYVRGKFTEGKYNDGMLIYPKFTPYQSDDEGRLNSTMPPDQYIIIAPGLSVDGNSYKIKAGDGLRMLAVMDIDTDGIDEVVKINTNLVNELLRKVAVVSITVYEISPTGALTTKIHNYQIEEDGAVDYGTGKLCPVPMNFVFGNFNGGNDIDLLAIAIDYKKDDSPKFIEYMDLADFKGKRISEEYSSDSYTEFLSGDFNGDGRDELCILSGSNPATVNSVSESEGIQQLFMDNSVNYNDMGRDNSRVDVYTVDVNRDGLTDLLYPPTRSRIDEKGQITVQRWVPEVCPLCGKQNPILNDYTKTCRQCGGDIYQYYYKNGGAMCPDCGKEMQGDYFPDIDGFVCPAHGRGKITKWITLDNIINGTEWTALLSTGKGFVTVKYPLGAWNREKFSLLDIDSDGFVDIVSSKDGDISVMLNHNGTFANSAVGIEAKGEVMPLNIRGAGSSHFVVLDKGTAHCYEYTADKSLCKLITSSVNSLGVTTVNEYGKMTGTGCHEYADAAGDTEINLLAPVSLLSRTEVKAGNVTVSNISYHYTGSKLDLRGGGFRGFNEVEETDSINGNTTVTEYSDIDIVTRTDSRDNTAVYTYKNLETQPSKFHNKRVGSVVVTDKPTGVVTRKSYTYDGYGNPLTETERFDGSDAATSATVTYRNDDTQQRYHVGLPLTRTVKRTRGGQWTDKETFTYDASGRPLTKTVHTGVSGTVKKKETRWTYDAWGNVLSEMSSPYGSGTFTGESYAYDSSGRYMTEKTDALGLATSYSGFDRHGNPTSEEDFRGNVTAYTYDCFGRLTGKNLPTGAVQTVTFGWGGNGVYQVTVTESGKPDKVTEYDALGREVRSRTMRFDGQWQSVSRVYNAKGQLEAESLPYTGNAPEYWNGYEYDTYGRLVKTVEASGNVSTASYSKLSVTEESRGVEKTTVRDASGLVASVTDPGGKIIYSYRPDGQIKSMTAPGGTVTEITYDAAGRRTSIVDPSAGNRTTSYAYNSGELTVTETDADGRAVVTTYDKYGRMVRQERPEFNTTYGYNGYGQLAMVVSDNGTMRNYIYDTFGRVLTETESVPDGKLLSKTYYYGSDGVPAGMLYAGGQVYHELLYGYSHGTLTEISLSGGGGTVWKLTEANALGQPTKVETGCISREYGYTDYGMPLYRKFGAHQHFTYNFDPYTGNLLSRTDALRGIMEEYGYDNLNRLTDENGRETEYAANGNVVSRDKVGTVGYGSVQDSYKVKKITAVADKDFSYSPLSLDYTSFSRPAEITKHPYASMIIADRQNRTLATGGIAIRDSSWFEGIKYPIDTVGVIIGPPQQFGVGTTATFTYNERGERVKMEVTDGDDVLACRYYIGGVYEVDEVTGEERLYIGGDAYTAPAVDICNAGGEWKLHFIGRDYLGSVTHIADSEGNLVAEYSYDAWGRLRDPATYELYGSGDVPELMLWRGFTGHEWLPWFGLYNMNARLYDPVLGRFMSPDPYVQMPDNTQNLNRYLYALNNPFQYTDPSGEFFITLLAGALIGAGVSALTYSVATLVTGNSWSWKNFGKSLGIGAFGGMLGGATGYLGGALGNSFGYNMVSQIANSTITNAIFCPDFDYRSLLGIATGALVGTMIPYYSAHGGNAISNGMAEIGYNTMRGAVTGLASGFVDSSLYGNADLIWQNAVGGAISGGSRSIFMNAIFGAPYKPAVNEYEAEGLFRKGGLADIISGSGDGMAIGRNLYTHSGPVYNEYNEQTRLHEMRHLLQQLDLGFAKFYGRILIEYIVQGYDSSTLESDASSYAYGKIKILFGTKY